MEMFAASLEQRHGVIDPWHGLQYKWDLTVTEELDVVFEPEP
jgi:hypothetical protein